MKNKEIEELLNTFKELINTYSPDTEPFTIDYDYEIKCSALESLLSYIEQLEKDNKDLDKENQILFETNLKLQNNRDKAIKKCQDKQYQTNHEWLKRFAKEIENILKGDSDDK